MKRGKNQDREKDMRQVMAEEGSRGRARPKRAVSLELERRIRIAADRLADPGCDRETYTALIRDDFGLVEGSPEFLQFLKAWDDCH